MSTITKADQLREELMTVLEQDQLDFDRFQKLSSELAKSEPEAVRFSVDAGLISRLGRELVARQETAVAELVKNAYDADAREVTLVFSEADAPGGRLEIRDDGLGMTREQLINGFMRLSSNEKVDQPISPRYRRQRAGRKGIGRFAVQRLGRKLTIRTQTKDSPLALEVVIDWDAFAVGLDLTAVTSRIHELPKGQKEGTTLLISGLREGWDEAAIRKVYRYVLDLLQPFPLSETKSSSRNDPGFKVNLYREHEGEITLVADEKTEIFSYALAEVKGYVDDKGQGYWSIRSDKLDINEDKPFPEGKGRTGSRSFQNLRNVEFRAFYYIDDSVFLPRSVRKTVRELLRDKGGIRVYRNGFRVPPYGDLDDDWLKLDESTRKKYILPPHANNNFFGFVEIVDVEGKQFEETSSREGLLNNHAFKELQDFVLQTLIAAVLRVAEARGRKGVASSKGRQEDNPDVIVTKAIKSVDKLAKDLVRVGQSSEAKQLKDVSKQLKVAASVQGGMLEELSMLRVLGSLGLTIGEFTHEVQQTLGATYLGARQLLGSVAEGSEAYEIAYDLFANVQRFKAYASYFQQAVSDNVRRELEPQDIAKISRDFIVVIQPAAKSVGICIEALDIVGSDLLTCAMHPSEWSSVLFNFYTNARKAIARAGKPGKISVRVGREENIVYLEFADNGDGIPEENENRIFNAFFTTTGPSGRYASEEEELQGTGLGLKIVQDIASSYNGKVQLVSPPAGYATCFRIELPEATSEERETYGY